MPLPDDSPTACRHRCAGPSRWIWMQPSIWIRYPSLRTKVPCSLARRDRTGVVPAERPGSRSRRPGSSRDLPGRAHGGRRTALRVLPVGGPEGYLPEARQRDRGSLRPRSEPVGEQLQQLRDRQSGVRRPVRPRRLLLLHRARQHSGDLGTTVYNNNCNAPTGPSWLLYGATPTPKAKRIYRGIELSARQNLTNLLGSVLLRLLVAAGKLRRRDR